MENKIRNIIEKECEDYFLGTTDLSLSDDPMIHKYGTLITEYPIAISFGITIPSMDLNNFTKDYSKIYEHTNCKLRGISNHLIYLLEDEGYKAFPVPKSKVIDTTFTSIHNLAASNANLGIIEKNGSFVIPEAIYGVNWGTVLTNAVI